MSTQVAAEADRDYASRNVPASFDPRRLEPLDPIRIEIMRRLKPEERLEIAFQLNRFARERIAADLRWRSPDWSEDQIQTEVARRMLRGAS
jgi:hypothetical protein